MNKIIYLLFFSIFTLDYISIDLSLVSRFITWFPELLSALVIVLIVLIFSSTKMICIKKKYVILFTLFATSICISIIYNAVSPEIIFGGVRNYIKFFPFFLLSAIYSFTNEQIKSQLKLLLILAIIQIPIVLFQRFIQFKNLHPDLITGTLMVSSVLSIYLISTITVLIAFFLRKKITGFVSFSILCLLLFIPTTLNETKGTLVLFPIAITIPLMFVRNNLSNFKQLVAIFSVGAISVTTFAFVYDKLYGENYEIADFFMSSSKIEHYLYGGAATGKVYVNQSESGLIDGKIGTTDRVGRIDSFLLPIRVLFNYYDSYRLFFGLGIGNVSNSFFKQLQGKYAVFQEKFSAGRTALSLLLWETGLIGVFLSLIFLYFIFRDARYLIANDNGLSGTFALGWIAILVITFITLFYKNIIVFNALGYLFWYFSGYVAAARYRLENYRTVN